MTDSGIGRIESFEIRRTGEGTYSVFLVPVPDGQGGTAGVDFRAHHADEEWWKMVDLDGGLAPDPDNPPPDAVMEIAFSATIPDAGKSTNFKAITYRLAPDGSKVWGHKTPGENDGTGPAHVHTWGPWPPPEPEPPAEDDTGEPSVPVEDPKGKLPVGTKLAVWARIWTPWKRFVIAEVIEEE